MKTIIADNPSRLRTQLFKVCPCWCDAADFESVARTVESATPREAAEAYVFHCFADLDYEREVEVRIRDAFGADTRWKVIVHMIPDPEARQIKE